MQVRRGVFFARSLRERFEPGKKKAAIRGFFLRGSYSAFGPPPRYAVRHDDLGAGGKTRRRLERRGEGRVLCLHISERKGSPCATCSSGCCCPRSLQARRLSLR